MIKDDIRAALGEAMKARDQIKVDTLRGALAAFTNELVAKGRKPTDTLSEEEAVIVLKRLVKQRKDAIEQFGKGGRQDLVDKETTELKVIEGYVPAGASREAIETVAKAKIAELGIADKSGMGKLMGAIIKEFGGTADGNDVKDVLARLLP